MQTEIIYNKSIEDRFNDFNRKNPKVYELFKKFALEAIRNGHNKLGSKMIVERIRWYTNMTFQQCD